MDGKSMPGANNVAVTAKTIGTNTKAAAEAIAISFNTAIKYICDNIKTETFAKGLDKKIDLFCKSTQKSITKLFGAFTFSSKMLKEAEKSDRAVSIIQGFTSKLTSIQVPKNLDKTMKSVADSVNTAKAIIECIADIAKQSLLVTLLIIPALLGLVEMKLFIRAISWLATSISKIKIDKSKIKVIINMRDMIKAIMQIAWISALFILIAPIAIVGLLAMLTFILAVKLLSIVLNLIKISKNNIDLILSLEKMVKAILKVAMISALFILIAPFAILGLVGMTMFIAGLGLMGLLLNIIAPLFADMKHDVKNLLKIVTLLLLTATTMCLFLLIAPFLPQAMLTAILFVIGLLPIAIFLKIIVEIFEEIKWDDMLKLLAMIAITLVIAFMLVIISKLGNQISWEGLGLFGLSLLAVVGVIAALAFTVGFMVVGLIAIAMIAGSVGMLLLTAMALVKISEIADKIDDKAFAKIIGAIVSGFKEMFTPENLAFLNPISLFFIMGSIIELTMIVGAIGLMAGILQDIASMKIPTEFDSNGKPIAFKVMDSKDFTDAAQNAGSIIEFFGKMFAGGGKLSNGTKIPDLSPFLDIDISLSTKIKFRRLKKIVGYIGEMAEILQNIASLNMPDSEAGYDANGNPKGWKKMKKEDFMEAADSAGAIITFFAKLFTDDKIDVPSGSIDNPVAKLLNDGTTISWFAKRRIARIADIVSYVGDMATVLQKIASMNIPIEWDKDGKAIKYEKMKTSDFTKYAENVKDILNVLIDSVTSDKVKEMIAMGILGAEEAFENLGLLVSPINGMVDIITKLVTLQVPVSEIDGTIKKDKDGNIIYKTFKIDEELPNAIESVKKIADAIIEIGSSAAENIGSKLAGGLFNDIESSFNNLNLLMGPITSMVDMVVKIAEAKIPKGYDAEGNPTGYRKLRDKDIIKARLYIEKLSNSIIGLFLTGEGKETALLDKLKNLGKSADGIDTGMNAIKSCVLGFGEITDSIGNNKKLESGEAFNKIGPNIETLIQAISKFKDTNPKALKYLGHTSTYIKTLGEANSSSIKESTENLSKFVKQINDTNVDKLKHAADMMKNIAQLSKSINGNFEELANTLSEKLMSVLKELKEILEKASEEIKEHHESSSSSSRSAFGANSKKVPEAISSPAKDEKDKNTKKIDLTETNRKIGEVTAAINNLYAEISDRSFRR